MYQLCDITTPFLLLLSIKMTNLTTIYVNCTQIINTEVKLTYVEAIDAYFNVENYCQHHRIIVCVISLCILATDTNMGKRRINIHAIACFYFVYDISRFKSTSLCLAFEWIFLFYEVIITMKRAFMCLQKLMRRVLFTWATDIFYDYDRICHTKNYQLKSVNVLVNR